MTAFSSAGKRVPSCLFTLATLALAASPCRTALAQESAFVACDRYTDREQRIACLEAALEAATAEPAPPPAAADPAPVADTPAAQTGQGAAAEGRDPPLSERAADFGRQETPRVSTDAQGRDQLEDAIAKLEKRNGLWIVTLSGGQVWRQEFPRPLNLREGDEIIIYQAGFGNGYRLSAKRINGFIRVERVR